MAERRTVNKLGRPLQYDPDYHIPVGAQKMREGFTKKELAKYFGIHLSTMMRWQEEYREFREALRVNAEVANAQVEAAVFKMTQGYTVEETKIIGTQTPNGFVPTRAEKITRHVPPNATTQIFWLKNRMGARWQDVQEVLHGGNITIEDPRAEILSRIARIASRNGEVEGDHEPDDGRGPETPV